MNYKSAAAIGLILLFWFLTGEANEALARNWTSKTGGFSVEAELVEATATEVKLRKKDGKVISVAIDKLSEADVKYLKSLKSPATTGAKLVPISFKILDEEFTMDVPKGAKVDEEGAFPKIRQGSKFVMSIQPYGESDLPDFKERFTNTPDAIAIKKVLVEEDDALAYTVTMTAFKADASAYMVVVAVGDKKYTCSDASLEDMNRKDKLSAKDIELMIRCARTLKSNAAPSDSVTEAPATDEPATDEPAADDSETPLVEYTVKPFSEELTLLAPEGAEVTDSIGKTRIRKGEDFDFEVNWTESESELEDFERIYSNTAIYSIKSALVESDDARAYEVVRKFPQPAKTACVFIVTKKIGDHRYACKSVTFGGFHEDDSVFNVPAAKLMIRSAQSLKLK